MFDTVTGSMVSNNPLLTRRNLLDRETAAEQAALNLKIMAHNGELHIPEAWINDLEEQIIPWGPEDGDVFDCYMDILGLNGRAPADSMKWETRNKRRETRRSQREEESVPGV